VVARNLEPLYGNDTAIEAFARLRQRHPQARLTIAGSGPDAARLRALCEQRGLSNDVHFTGRLDRDAMAALYRQADVVLNPSHADNMPNSLLEAMASGVPVVSTNVGGVPYMVRDGETALLVPPGDAPAMAAAAERLLADAALWQQLAAAGLAEVRRYTWPQVAPELAALYRGALAH
jgi:glycosyltransferase involved in cell wall biosynthesis